MRAAQALAIAFLFVAAVGCPSAPPSQPRSDSVDALVRDLPPDDGEARVAVGMGAAENFDRAVPVYEGIHDMRLGLRESPVSEAAKGRAEAILGPAEDEASGLAAAANDDPSRLAASDAAAAVLSRDVARRVRALLQPGEYNRLRAQMALVWAQQFYLWNDANDADIFAALDDLGVDPTWDQRERMRPILRSIATSAAGQVSRGQVTWADRRRIAGEFDKARSDLRAMLTHEQVDHLDTAMVKGMLDMRHERQGQSTVNRPTASRKR